MSATAKVFEFSKPSRTPKYDAMTQAINEAYHDDEVAAIVEEAERLAQYDRQAENTFLEQWVCEIRLRAERQRGKIEKKKAGRPKKESFSGKAISATERTRNFNARQLAAVPDDVFEEAVKQPGATISSIVREHAPTRPVDPAREEIRRIDPKLLWLAGRLDDFTREGILDADPDALMATAPERVQQRIREALPAVLEWLGRVR